jgi:hypothetical protein
MARSWGCRAAHRLGRRPHSGRMSSRRTPALEWAGGAAALEWAASAALGIGRKAAVVGEDGGAVFRTGRKAAGAISRTECRATGDRRPKRSCDWKKGDGGCGLGIGRAPISG